MRANWTAFTFNKRWISTGDCWAGDLMAYNFRILQAKKVIYWHAHNQRQIKISIWGNFMCGNSSYSVYHGHGDYFLKIAYLGQVLQQMWPDLDSEAQLNPLSISARNNVSKTLPGRCTWCSYLQSSFHCLQRHDHPASKQTGSSVFC